MSQQVHTWDLLNKLGRVPTRNGGAIKVVVLCHRACEGCYVTFDT